MGLDTYASRSAGDIELTTEDRQAFTRAAVELCGGMMSGDDGSFRGKVYADVVDRVADVSLYAEWLPPDEVRRIWAAFELCNPARVAEESKADIHPATEAEIEALRAFFGVCAARGLGLIGSW
jgi:hypothetical protein